MKKILKGIGLFIVALFMVFSSLTTPVEAAYSSYDLKIEYKDSADGAVKKTEYKNLRKEDVVLNKNYQYADITLQSNTISTSNSIKIKHKATVDFHASQTKKIIYSSSEEAGLFEISSVDGASLNIYNCSFEVNVTNKARLVTNIDSDTHIQGKDDNVYLRNVRVLFKGTASNNSGIMASSISLNAAELSGTDELKASATNGNLFWALFPYGSNSNGNSIIAASNTSFRNFYSAMLLTNCRDDRAVIFTDTTTFEDNTVDIYRKGKTLYLNGSAYVRGSGKPSGGAGSMNNVTLYETTTDAPDGNVAVTYTSGTISLQSKNSDVKYTKVTQDGKTQWIVGDSFDPTKHNYTNNNNNETGSSTLSASDTNYTLTMSALDMILDGDDAQAYNGLTVTNKIPNTSYVISYQKKGEGETYSDYTDSTFGEGDYKVTLKLTKTDGTAIPHTVNGSEPATITKKFHVYKNSDVTLDDKAKYKVDNNVIEVKPDGKDTDIYLITLEPISEKPYVIAKNDTKLPNGTALHYSWEDANDSSKKGEGLPTTPGTYTITGTLKKKNGETWEVVNDSDGNPVKITTTITIPESSDVADGDAGQENTFDPSKATISADPNSNSITATDGTNKISINFNDPINPKYTGEPIDMSKYVNDDITDLLGGSITYTYEGVNGTTYGPSNTAPSNIGTYKVTLTYTDKNGNTYTITKEITISPSSDDSLNDKSCKSSKGSNYAWSSKKQACVYKVTNTGSN